MKDENIIVKYLRENKYFNCEKVFIRGSYALNTYNKYSDLDILVVSSDFRGLDIITRKKLIQKSLDLKSELKLDAICLTYDELMSIYEHATNSLDINELVEVLI